MAHGSWRSFSTYMIEAVSGGHARAASQRFELHAFKVKLEEVAGRHVKVVEPAQRHTLTGGGADQRQATKISRPVRSQDGHQDLTGLGSDRALVSMHIGTRVEREVAARTVSGRRRAAAQRR